MNSCVIGLGSNIDAHIHIPQAKADLSRFFSIVKESRLSITKPIGFPDQPDFTNGAVLVQTPLPQDQVVAILKDIEAQLGRIHTSNKFGPRTIDLDILVWNNEIVDQDVYSRDFLKQSILELKPDFMIKDSQP